LQTEEQTKKEAITRVRELLIASHMERRKATNPTILRQLPTFWSAMKQIYLSFFNLL